MDAQFAPGTCSDCGAAAACEYDYGTGLRRACAAHDPLRPLLAAAARVPQFYRTLALFPVTIDFGNVGTGTHHRPVRCPRCGELAVWWTEGDEHAVCHGKNNTCGRLIGLDELDALAAEQDRVRTTAAAGDSAEPAA